MPALLVLVIWTVFLPSLKNEFVSWDDIKMFPGNPRYRGLGPDELRWMWTTFHYGEYMPVTWMTYGADYLVWGLNPFGYHVTNLLLHALTALVVYNLARRLLRTAASGEGDDAALSVAALLAALLFAIHPLRAEPVAWASARGSILGGLFALLTVLAYLKASAGRDGGRTGSPWLAGATGMFALALLSRSTNLMLPAVLVVLDVYPLRRLGSGAGRWVGREVRHVWLEKVPFVLLGLIFIPVAFMARRMNTGHVLAEVQDSLLTGVAVAAHGLTFYLKTTLLLGALSPLYERAPRIEMLDWPFLASGAVVLMITVFLLIARRRWPAGLTAWICYALVLVPTLGIIPFGLQMAADRYTYVSCIGWALLAGGGSLAWSRAWRQGRIGTRVWICTGILALTVVLGLGILTWRQVQVWRDSKTLWTHVLSVEPRSAVAHISLGSVFASEGNLAQAMAHYQQAVEIWPHAADLHTDLGRALLDHGRPAEAREYLRKATLLRPGSAEARLLLGIAFLAAGNAEEAIEQHRIAARIHPDSAVIHYNLGLALASSGRVSEGIEHYEAALRLRPGFDEARAGLQLALGRLEERVRGRHTGRSLGERGIVGALESSTLQDAEAANLRREDLRSLLRPQAGGTATR